MVGPSAVVLAIAFATGAAGYAVPSVRVGRSASGSPTRSAVVRLQGEPAAADLQDLAPEGEIISSNTYGLMLTTLLKTNESIAGQISANYGLIDYAFLQRLDEAVAEGKPDMKERLEEIKGAVNAEMASRMQAAAEAMRDLVTSPTPIVMEGKIAALARQGRLDDALLQLLQANLEQAEAAGEQGKGAVQVITRLQTRVQQELDEKLAPEAKLLRRLLRMDDAEARKKLLREKMQPKKGTSIVLAGVTKEQEEAAKDTKPEISPRMVAKAIEQIKRRFGNVDETYDTGFVSRLEAIASEAEEERSWLSTPQRPCLCLCFATPALSTPSPSVAFSLSPSVFAVSSRSVHALLPRV